MDAELCLLVAAAVTGKAIGGKADIQALCCGQKLLQQAEYATGFADSHAHAAGLLVPRVPRSAVSVAVALVGAVIMCAPPLQAQSSCHSLRVEGLPACFARCRPHGLGPSVRLPARFPLGTAQLGSASCCNNLATCSDLYSRAGLTVACALAGRTTCTFIRR